jgi:hypothetical protein
MARLRLEADREAQAAAALRLRVRNLSKRLESHGAPGAFKGRSPSPASATLRRRSDPKAAAGPAAGGPPGGPAGGARGGRGAAGRRGGSLAQVGADPGADARAPNRAPRPSGEAEGRRRRELGRGGREGGRESGYTSSGSEGSGRRLLEGTASSRARTMPPNAANGVKGHGLPSGQVPSRGGSRGGSREPGYSSAGSGASKTSTRSRRSDRSDEPSRPRNHGTANASAHATAKTASRGRPKNSPGPPLAGRADSSPRSAPGMPSSRPLSPFPQARRPPSPVPAAAAAAGAELLAPPRLQRQRPPLASTSLSPRIVREQPTYEPLGQSVGQPLRDRSNNRDAPGNDSGNALELLEVPLELCLVSPTEITDALTPPLEADLEAAGKARG